ncbi:hypothetical protein Q5P01_009293 [Channa striata]|uniref:BHLH domain-containing protein n=1 Tax=Channa striata TaxID=64152 RepID=A0AA88N6I1_CHASR|nr:hypothetical protein Q5P01_009293 [Channa striata]
MKTLSPPESPKQRSTRRVSKPLMEKRRRERINQSLETLRLLMLDNTGNEKLKNPKVEKAEILESVVQFLKSENEAGKGHRASTKVNPREQKRACDPQSSYHDGMRSCLLRFNHFMASRSQASQETGGDAVQASFALPGPRAYPSAPGSIRRALVAAAGGQTAALPPQHPPHHHLCPAARDALVGDTGKLLAPTAPTPPSTLNTDPVWRPWPQ